MGVLYCCAVAPLGAAGWPSAVVARVAFTLNFKLRLGKLEGWIARGLYCFAGWVTGGV